MANAGLLGGKFLFKKLSDGSLNREKVICTLCNCELSYHRSTTSLTYHLKAKHPSETAAGPNQASILAYTTALAQQKGKIAMLTDQELSKLQRLEELLEPCR